MRNLILVSIVAAAMVLPAQAQRFGGFGGGGFRGSGGFRGGFGVGNVGFRGTTGVRTGLPSRGMPIRTSRGTRVIIRTFPGPFFGFNNGFGRFGFGSNFCFANPILCRGRFGFHRRFRNHFGFGFPFGFGAFGWGGASWPYYPWDYSDYGYTSANYASAIEQQRLEAEVGDLEQELRRQRVRRMEEEEDRQAQAEAQRSAPPPAKPATVQQPQKPTVLVFRDQHRAEIQNYAIVDGTVYEFAPPETRKILLSELDVPATVRANEDRGVEFRVPGAHR